MAKPKPRDVADEIPVYCRFDEIVGTETLVKNPRNPNTHPPKQIELLAKIIKNQGWRQPITVSNRSGFIVKGHGRLDAAIQMGAAQVPVEYQEYSTEAEEYADLIADNRIAELAEIDGTILTDLLHDDSIFDGFDLELAGFDHDSMPNINLEKDEKDDLIPEQIPPICTAGQLWKLGNHRLLCGDATNPADVARVCNDTLVDLWLTDPPYNVAYEGSTADKLTIQNDDMADDEFRTFLTNAFIAATEWMKKGAVFYIWHADYEGFNFRGACKDAGLQVRQCLIWKKNALVMGRQDYHWMHEPCLYGWKDGAAHLWASDRKQTTILNFDKPRVNDIHPTMKPVELISYQILNNTKGDDIILDSFLGSGSTLIACEKLGRRCYGTELDPHYCDVIIARWEEFTGKKAEVIEDA